MKGRTRRVFEGEDSKGLGTQVDVPPERAELHGERFNFPREESVMTSETSFHCKTRVIALAVAGFACAYSAGVLAQEVVSGVKKGPESKAREAQEAAFKEATVTHEDAITKLVVKRNIPIAYSYIATLMRIPNAFGEGAACIVCHSSNDPKRSYRGLNLASCQGILDGSAEPPVRPVVVPRQPDKSLMKTMLRNNRMPIGVAFDAPIDTPAITIVKKWIDGGAKDDEFFKKQVMPLFKSREAFGSRLACVDCHMSNQEPPSFHELDLTSYKGIMLGADSIANAKEGKPASKVVHPGSSATSKLYTRLIENRMPAGISPAQDRDHPNTQMLLAWIKQGAKCD